MLGITTSEIINLRSIREGLETLLYRTSETQEQLADNKIDIRVLYKFSEEHEILIKHLLTETSNFNKENKKLKRGQNKLRKSIKKLQKQHEKKLKQEIEVIENKVKKQLEEFEVKSRVEIIETKLGKVESVIDSLSEIFGKLKLCDN